MRLINTRALLAAGGALFALGACSQDLVVPNTNDPDTKHAISTPADVANLAASSIQTWQDATQEMNPATSLAVMADALTSSFNNFGMNLSSSEPRIAYPNNTTGGDYTAMAQDPWYANYTALGEANDALAAIAGGVVIGTADSTEAYKAIAMLTQGVALGNIALIFDQGYVVDETSVLPVPVDSIVKYPQVSAAAVAKLDALVALTQGKTWGLPSSVLPIPGVDLTAENLGKIANTMAARILAYTPRDGAENDAANWAAVLSHAENGISSGAAFDFSIQEDGGNLWWDGYKAYGDYDPWMRTSMRIMHEMNPSLPERYTACSSIPNNTSSPDHRFVTDFTYIADIPFACARGAWHFSNWAHTRYVDVSWQSGLFTGVAPLVLAAENDLLWAEALVRTGGDLNLAATLVNKTRVGRGQLAPVSADHDALLAAIQYEQDVELLTTGGGLQWFNRRRIDGLQQGTPRHLPVPAKELEIDQLPIYTFGGAPPNPVYPDK